MAWLPDRPLISQRDFLLYLTCFAMMILTLAVLAGVIVSCIVCPQTRPGRRDELALLERQLRENRALSRLVQAGLENCIAKHNGQQDPLYCYDVLERVLRQVQQDCRQDLYDVQAEVMPDAQGRLYMKQQFRKTGAQFLSLLAVQRQIALLHS